jgi:uncharacterized protein YabE (DUF348 family)
MVNNAFIERRVLLIATSSIVALFFGLVLAHQADAQSTQPVSGERLLSVYDEGVEKGVLTRASTLREAFQEAGIRTDPNDRVEPGLDDKLESSHYEVNIYRARPVTIVDGETRIKVMSPYRTAKQIAEEAGLMLHDEDIATMTAGTDVVGQGMGTQLAITRATEFKLKLYGKQVTAYTQAKTVAEMLKDKGITLGSGDTISVPLSAPITTGMAVDIWRNGAQTVTDEQAIPFATQKILDMDHPIGYHQVKTKGAAGVRLVTYVVVMQGGKEVGRKMIQSVVNSQPKTQVELIGNKPVNPLSKSKGAGYFTDSQGVSHRETYYDLPMNAVMGACGGGTYTIRADGAKVDRDGYILIAANYNRYPRCSIVETSMGLGKVYDTGGFAARHPDGFDLATDWTNYDGR